MRAPPWTRALAAELIGRFALVFAGAGAVMVDAKTGALGHVGVQFLREEETRPAELHASKEPA
jgi:glycerol uptake facilitator-like aquaporin